MRTGANVDHVFHDVLHALAGPERAAGRVGSMTPLRVRARVPDARPASTGPGRHIPRMQVPSTAHGSA